MALTKAQVTIPISLLVAIGTITLALGKTYNAAAGNTEDIAALTQAQAKDHEFIARQDERIKNIDVNMKEIDEQMETMSARQMEQIQILYELKAKLD